MSSDTKIPNSPSAAWFALVYSYACLREVHRMSPLELSIMIDDPATQKLFIKQVEQSAAWHATWLPMFRKMYYAFSIIDPECRKRTLRRVAPNAYGVRSVQEITRDGNREITRIISREVDPLDKNMKDLFQLYACEIVRCYFVDKRDLKPLLLAINE